MQKKLVIVFGCMFVLATVVFTQTVKHTDSTHADEVSNGKTSLVVHTPDGDKQLNMSSVVDKIGASGEIGSDFDAFTESLVSPDGTRMAFVLHGVAWDYIGVWNVSTDEIITLAYGEGGYERLQWSPDGEEVAFIAGEEVVALQVRHASTGEKLFDSGESGTPATVIEHVKWEPDSTHISFAVLRTIDSKTEEDKRRSVSTIDRTVGIKKLKRGKMQ